MSLPVKPPVKMESRDPHSIRFSPTEWEQITAAALARGIEPSRFARRLCLTGLSMLRAQAAMEGHVGETA